MEDKPLVLRLTTALRHGTRQGSGVVFRPHDEPRILLMIAPEVSTQRGEDNAIVTTNLIVSKFMGGRAGWLGLSNRQTLLPGRQERTDTSRRSSLPSSLCVADPSGLDSPGSSWCTTSQRGP